MSLIKLETRVEVGINYKNVCYVERANNGTRYYFVGNSNPVFLAVPFEEAVKELDEVRWL